MRNKFPGLIKLTAEEIEKIWAEAIISFDANTLLDLYRVSENTSKELLNLLNRFSNQVWITHQSAFEFLKNRVTVIRGQRSLYSFDSNKNILGDSLNKIEIEISKRRSAPFLSKELTDQIFNLFNSIRSEMKLKSNQYIELLSDDSIYKELEYIIKNKIGDEYDDQNYKQIIKEGEERLKNNIPPGFEDYKDPDKKGFDKYGDYILWRQLIDKAIETQKPIIFVTSEDKIDWWWYPQHKKENNQKIGSRYELIQEMKKKANVDFLLYTTENFLKYGMKKFNLEPNQVAIDEIHNLSSQIDKDEHGLRNEMWILRDHEFSLEAVKAEYIRLKTEISKLDKELEDEDYNNEFADIGQDISMGFHNTDTDEQIAELQERIDSTQKRRRVLSLKRNLLTQKLNNLIANYPEVDA